MHEKIRQRKSCKLGLKSAKSTVQTKITSPMRQAPCLNPGHIWTNSKSSNESVNHNNVTANLKPKLCSSSRRKTRLDQNPRRNSAIPKNRVKAHKKGGKNPHRWKNTKYQVDKLFIDERNNYMSDDQFTKPPQRRKSYRLRVSMKKNIDEIKP